MVVRRMAARLGPALPVSGQGLRLLMGSTGLAELLRCGCWEACLSSGGLGLAGQQELQGTWGHLDRPTVSGAVRCGILSWPQSRLCLGHGEGSGTKCFPLDAGAECYPETPSELHAPRHKHYVWSNSSDPIPAAVTSDLLSQARPELGTSASASNCPENEDRKSGPKSTLIHRCT